MAHEAGKGSAQRPTDQKAYGDNWETIFRGKNAPVSEPKGEADRAHPMDETDRK